MTRHLKPGLGRATAALQYRPCRWSTAAQTHPPPVPPLPVANCRPALRSALGLRCGCSSVHPSCRFDPEDCGWSSLHPSCRFDSGYCAGGAPHPPAGLAPGTALTSYWPTHWAVNGWIALTGAAPPLLSDPQHLPICSCPLGSPLQPALPAALRPPPALLRRCASVTHKATIASYEKVE